MASLSRLYKSPRRVLRFSTSVFLIRRPPICPLFPYTTLFRSLRLVHKHRERGGGERLGVGRDLEERVGVDAGDRKSTRLNSSHLGISYAVFCSKKKRVIGCVITACVG